MTRHTSSVREITTTLSRLTPRDHAIVRLIGDHGVFTTDQLHRVFFTSLKRAQLRLLDLYRLELLDRFRTRIVHGSEQWHYVLAPLGAQLHAAATDQPAPTPSKVTATVLRMASHPGLRHRVGVNDFFVRIIAATRARPDAELSHWVTEATAARTLGGRLRPDAAATYTQDHWQVSFWFEHDRGTETLTTLTDKADRYRDATVLAEPRPVLFELPNPAREAHLHEHLHGRYFPFPLATTHAAIAANPTGPVWRFLHQTGQAGLIDLANPQRA